MTTASGMDHPLTDFLESLSKGKCVVVGTDFTAACNFLKDDLISFSVYILIASSKTKKVHLRVCATSNRSTSDSKLMTTPTKHLCLQILRYMKRFSSQRQRVVELSCGR